MKISDWIKFLKDNFIFDDIDDEYIKERNISGEPLPSVKFDNAAFKF